MGKKIKNIDTTSYSGSTFKKGFKYDKMMIVQEIVELKIKMKLSQHSIIKYLSEKYGYKSRKCYYLINEASKLISDIYRDWNKSALEEAILDLEEQREHALKEGNRNLVFLITKEMNKIKGLYIERHDIKHDLNMRFEFNFGDSEEQIKDK